jgi:hypothetical protein
MENEPLPIRIRNHKGSTSDPLFVPEMERDNGGLPGRQLYRKIFRVEMLKRRSRLRSVANRSKNLWKC